MRSMRLDTAFRSIKVIRTVMCQLEKKVVYKSLYFLIHKSIKNQIEVQFIAASNFFFWLFVGNAPKRASGFRLIGSPYYLDRIMQGLVTSRVVVHCQVQITSVLITCNTSSWQRKGHQLYSFALHHQAQKEVISVQGRKIIRSYFGEEKCLAQSFHFSSFHFKPSYQVTKTELTWIPM